MKEAFGRTWKHLALEWTSMETACEVRVEKVGTWGWGLGEIGLKKMEGQLHPREGLALALPNQRSPKHPNFEILL